MSGADFGNVYMLKFGPSGGVVAGRQLEVAIPLLCYGPGTLADYRLDGCDPAGHLGHRAILVPFYDPVTSAWNCSEHRLANEHADWPFSYV